MCVCVCVCVSPNPGTTIQCALYVHKLKYQMILQLTLVASAFLPINFVLKLDVFFTTERFAGGIFQITIFKYSQY